MSRVTLQLGRGDGQAVPLAAEIGDVPPWTIRVTLPGDAAPRSFAGPDLFESLAMLRREAEARGDLVLCAGARRDVYPSRMARDMGGGRVAYVLRAGQPAAREDLIDIFAPAEASAVVGVDEQRRSFDTWRELLR